MTVERIYWDSDVFLAWFQGEEGKADLCRVTLERAEANRVLIVASALVLAEVLWLRGSPPIPKDRAEIVQKFFRRSYIRMFNLTRSLAEAAQVLVWDHKIRPKDAIHVATALAANVDALETFDEDLIRKTGTVGTPSLVIRRPQPPRQGRLDFERPAQGRDG